MYHVVVIRYNDKYRGHEIYRDNKPFLKQVRGQILSRRKAKGIVNLLNALENS